VERWHQTLQVEFLNDAGPVASIDEAQAAVDAWPNEYNEQRPHQSLDMACPAGKFRPSPACGDALSLWAPADLEPVSTAPSRPQDAPAALAPASWPDAVEVDRVVPASGNITIGPQQFCWAPAEQASGSRSGLTPPPCT
jgi:hypothetical protein